MQQARFSQSLGSTFLIDLPSTSVNRISPAPWAVHAPSLRGLFPATREGRDGCWDWRKVDISDLSTGRVLATQDGRGAGLAPLEFSPDGSALLVESHTWLVGRPEACNSSPAATEFFVLSALDGSVTRVPDADAVWRVWYRDQFLEWECSPGLEPYRAGNSRFQCPMGFDKPGVLSYGGRPLLEAHMVDVLVVPSDPG